MKLMVKKCPECGFEARFVAVKKIINTGKKKRIVKVAGGKKRIISPAALARMLYLNDILFSNREEYEKMKKCPHCEIALKDILEVKND